MEINYEQLIKKILKFWKKYDEKNITAKEVREFFSCYEIATILCNNNFMDVYHNTVKNFLKKLYNLDGLFTMQESEELIDKFQNPENFFKYLSDERKLTFVSDDNYYYTVMCVKQLSSDEAKIRALNQVEDETTRISILCELDSDELKIKHLNKIPYALREEVISSLKNENLMEKHITFFNPNKGLIISKLSNEEKKEYYLRKFFRLLSNREKAEIIISFKNEEKRDFYLNLCNEEVILYIYNNKQFENNEFADKMIQKIKNASNLAEVLKYSSISSEIKIKYIDKISNHEELFEIISLLEDKYKIKFIDKLDDKEKIEIISSINDKNIKFKLFSHVYDKNLLFELIDHCEDFPEYSDEYEYIIDLYSNKYNLNKERLVFLIKNFSFSFLKGIKNPNIIKIMNASQESFEKLMSFFEQSQLEMNSSAMNDVLNALLQREFRINSPEIIFLYPNILNLILNGNEELIKEKIKKISENYDINSELSKKNWSLQQFIDLLLKKDEEAINCLHTISNKIIRNKRNNYIQENLHAALKKSTIVKYDKNDLIKYMINNYPIELIISFFPDTLFNSNEITEQEIEFLKDKELLRRIILYKKNPNNYDKIPDDIKNGIKLFNSVFEKFISCKTIEHFPDINITKKIYEYKKVDSEFILNILMHLDIDRMEKQLFNNPELFDKLSKIWNQYKIASWGKAFEPVLFDAGLTINGGIIADFIQYFGLSYETLQEEVKKGKIPNVSLTALLDLATCYNTETKKYSIIFGNENIKYIASNPGPNASPMKKEKRIEKAESLLKTIRNRTQVTVPPVDQNFVLNNGKKINVVVGNFSNIMNLTYGERTGSCMRIGGAGESLFEFCLENENGFHIRFSEPGTDKFISRVSGFRNGNTVFLNELRYSENPNYTNKDVVEACNLIASELIKLSKNSSFPIENIVITPFYSMEESNMSPQKLGISNPQRGMKEFYTDVSSTSIVLATSNQNNKLVPIKLGNKGVQKYPVKREKPKLLYDRECQEYLAHLKSLDQVLSGSNIDSVEIEIDENIIVCFAGEDWCVTIDKNCELNIFIMKNTNNKQKALEEAEIALKYLRENIEKEITTYNSVSLGM